MMTVPSRGAVRRSRETTHRHVSETEMPLTEAPRMRSSSLQQVSDDMPLSKTDQVLRQTEPRRISSHRKSLQPTDSGRSQYHGASAQRSINLDSKRLPRSGAQVGGSHRERISPARRDKRGMVSRSSSDVLENDEADTDEFFDAVEPPPDKIAPQRQRASLGEKRSSIPATELTAMSPTAGSSLRNEPSSRHDSHLLASNAKSRSARISKLTYNDVKQDWAEMSKDLVVARRALHCFLNSRMMTAYEIVEPHSESRLYYALAYAMLSTIKAIMTYEHQDLGTAISHCKDALHIANLMRKKQSAFSTFGRFVRGAGPSIAWLSSMTPVEKHAELIMSECTLLKAVLGIAHSGDLLGSLSEALNLRAAYGEYRSLLRYVEWEDANGKEKSDEDFRSGVYLGSGCISLILGLLPSKVLKIMEILGYEGSVSVGLKLLGQANGWSSDSTQRLPKQTIKTEGIRTALCDMSILMYHLVISTFIPVPSVDIDFSEKVLDYHLERYPEGVFFLYFHGRLYSTQACSEKAIECFKEARDVQEEYVQLKHICYWDMALAFMSLNNWKETAVCFDVLAKENNWSKALYHHARAAALYETGDPAAQEEAKEIMERVPSMTQRIAGKSIPLEKFAARKARKMNQYGYLFHPAMEFAYLTHCYTTASPHSLFRRALPTIDRSLARMETETNPSQDDMCLAHFLRGVILRNLAYPEQYVKFDSSRRYMSVDEAASKAEQSLLYVANNGAKCEYDHYMLYFCHYELGRLYISMGRHAEARQQLELVLSGKNLGDHDRKGKYSMQNMCILRSNGALELLQKKLKNTA